MDGRSNSVQKVAFSNFSCVVCTGSLFTCKGALSRYICLVLQVHEMVSKFM